MKILVTGGAGYIGSHIVKQLLNESKEYQITIIDNLSTGFQETIDTLIALNPKRVKFIKEDLSNWNRIGEILKRERFDTIIHLAASLIVSESIKLPHKYFLNNTANTKNLVEKSVKFGVKKFIFSSTAAVYGEPNEKEIIEKGIDENYPKLPINPYGVSKLLSEEIIQDIAKLHKDFKYVIIRYFNVAGADKEGLLGQSTKDATQLIKVASETAVGKRDKMYIFGDDYDTPDGTCIRDYIDVDDLAYAHILAINYLDKNRNDIFNCGYNRGYSVKEVIETMKRVTNRDFAVEVTSRREGDPSIIKADNSKIIKKMGWKPKYDDLEIICKTSYEWEKRLKNKT